MCGWTPRQKIKYYIKNECIEDEANNLPQFVEKSEAAIHTVNGLVRTEAGIEKTIHTFPLSENLREKTKHITQEQVFKNTIENTPYEFKMVEIDKLITSQGVVFLDFVEKLKQSFPQNPSAEQLFDICLTLTKEYAPISRLKANENTYIYASDSADFRVIGVFPKPVKDYQLSSDLITGIPVRSVIVLLGYGLPVATAVEVDKKIFLINGFHRLYALAEMGVKEVPLLIHKITDQFDLSPYKPYITEFLFNHPRPPLMKDFFNPDLTLEIKTIPRRKTIKVQVNHESFDVPL